LEKVVGCLPRLKVVVADGAYRGLEDFVRETLGAVLEVVERSPDQTGFKVLKWRWVVERTVAWVSRNRRMARDYEYLPATTEAFLSLAMSRLLLRRLANLATA